MKRLWIIARREYLAYVTTWGFWVSLAMVPVFGLVFGGMQAMLARSAPERAFAVIAEPGVIDAIDALLSERFEAGAQDRLAAVVQATGGEAATAEYRAALQRGAGPEAAARAAGVPDAAVQGVMQASRRQYVRLPAPADTEEGIRPYLTGERPVPGWEDRGPLYAAAFVRTGADGSPEVDYWSANLTNQQLRGLISDAVSRVMRDDALAAAGVDPQLVRDLGRLRPAVRDLSPDKEAGAEEVTLSDRLPFILGIGAGFFLWTVIFSVANMLLTSTIEEKSGKVLEVLLSSARLPEILAGKLLGVAGVSATLVGVWFGAGVVVLSLIANSAPQAAGPIAEVMSAMLSPQMIVPFVFYFAVGYLIYGAIFMAIGSLCETMQEAQTLMTPLIFILMAPMIMLVTSLSNPDSPLIEGAVWVPLFTPFLMMAQLPQDPPLWKLAATSVLMLITLFAVIWLGARVFRAGALGQAKPGSVLKAMKKA